MLFSNLRKLVTILTLFLTSICLMIFFQNCSNPVAFNSALQEEVSQSIAARTPSSEVCPADMVSCETDAFVGEQECRIIDNTVVYGNCEPAQCKGPFELINGICQSRVCENGAKTACQYQGAEGLRFCDNNTWGRCKWIKISVNGATSVTLIQNQFYNFEIKTSDSSVILATNKSSTLTKISGNCSEARNLISPWIFKSAPLNMGSNILNYDSGTAGRMGNCEWTGKVYSNIEGLTASINISATKNVVGIAPCTNGATNPPICTSVSPIIPSTPMPSTTPSTPLANCTVNGQKVGQGSFNIPSGYKSSTVPVGQSCRVDSYQGTCTNGSVFYSHRPMATSCSVIVVATAVPVICAGGSQVIESNANSTGQKNTCTFTWRDTTYNSSTPNARQIFPNQLVNGVKVFEAQISGVCSATGEWKDVTRNCPVPAAQSYKLILAQTSCREITYSATGEVKCNAGEYVAGTHDNGGGMPGMNGFVCCSTGAAPSGFLAAILKQANCNQVNYTASGSVMCPVGKYIVGTHDNGVGLPGMNGAVCCEPQLPALEPSGLGSTCTRITYSAKGRTMCPNGYFASGVWDDGVGMPGMNGLVCCPGP